jgi:hypothetical protein
VRAAVVGQFEPQQNGGLPFPKGRSTVANDAPESRSLLDCGSHDVLLEFAPGDGGLRMPATPRLETDQAKPVDPESLESQPSEAEQKFVRLRDEWRSKRGHHSDTASLVMHDAYQRIIGMGHAAIPFLLRELAERPDRWFWALRAITEQDPVPQEDRGNGKVMARAWLQWGREHGYRC